MIVNADKLIDERLLLNGINNNKPEYWYPVFNSSIHTANDEQLIADVSFEIGIGKQRGDTALSQGPVFSLFGEMQ